MDNYKFKSLEELYQKLLPALNTKVSDLKRNKIDSIKEEDIWNYLKINYWSKKRDLTLGEMVNDILSVSNNDLLNFIMQNRKEKIKQTDDIL